MSSGVPIYDENARARAREAAADAIATRWECVVVGRDQTRAFHVPASRQHGTYSCYTHGCRCVPCRDAKTTYTRLSTGSASTCSQLPPFTIEP